MCIRDSYKDGSTSNHTLTVTNYSEIYMDAFSPYDVEDAASTDLETYGTSITQYKGGNGYFGTSSASADFYTGGGFTAQCWVRVLYAPHHGFPMLSGSGTGNYYFNWEINDDNVESSFRGFIWKILN